MFKKEEYIKHDALSKKWGISLLTQFMPTKKTYENPGSQYDVDLVLESPDGTIKYVEVEHKLFNNFKYIDDSGLDIAGRKTKYYFDNKVMASHITFLDNYKMAILFNNKSLREHGKIIKKDCTRGVEEFIRIFPKHGLVFEYYENKWVKKDSLLTELGKVDLMKKYML